MRFKEEYFYSTGVQVRFEVIKDNVPVFVDYVDMHPECDQESIREHANLLCDGYKGDTCVVTVVTVFEWSEIK